ncbi:chromate efflux transporter [Rhodobacteraceae bacterium HSP-20]|uniref:Chromate efflux transporter n=1 Tax=Paragemmobacter amnigenus TaxID=2852097 RepID=A0ABS6IYQ0_9RHOB|nr:chromate efflux transporter [Rhodobacter amnigenus]MBU9696641.1 chromate efflux transporter [Rhodobacter amnigenus]MBV4387868.1 chromate efflux transporter [Rhodobacter amnigenus]
MTSFRDLFRTFGKIGLLSFGGPAAQIALMHRVLVDERKWLTEKDYLSALSFCMLLPGPEAMQLATWSGWRLRGTAGGLIAGLLFVLPGAAVVLALAAIYAAFGSVPLIQALFMGVQAAVAVIVIEALLRVGKRALKGRAALVIAALAFAALFLLDAPFPLVILAAGLWGFATAREAAGDLPAPPRAAHTARTVAIWSVVWLAPLGLLWLAEGGLLAEIGTFFAKLAILTFGGAYAVLAWMAQAVIEEKGWLTLRQMMDGLGLAETTPGPLILVTEFVGYVAAHRQGGWLMGLAGAAVTLWVTFVPSFLMIFAGAPWIARITADPRLAGALSAIMAAVVGVIANLSVWFAAHVFFAEVGRDSYGPLHLLTPDLSSLRPDLAALALLAGWLLLRRHWPLPLVLALCAAGGLGLHFLLPAIPAAS